MENSPATRLKNPFLFGGEGETCSVSAAAARPSETDFATLATAGDFFGRRGGEVVERTVRDRTGRGVISIAQ